MRGVLGDGLHLHAGRVGQHAQVLKQPLLDLLQVLPRVLVGHVGRADVQLEVRPEVLKVVVVGQLVGDGAVQRHRRLVGPAAGHVPDGVAASTQHQQGQVEALHVLHTLGMAWTHTHTESMTTQTHPPTPFYSDLTLGDPLPEPTYP